MLFFFLLHHSPELLNPETEAFCEANHFWVNQSPWNIALGILKIVFNNEKCYLFRGNPNYSRLLHSLSLGLQGVRCDIIIPPLPATNKPVKVEVT